MNTETVAQTQKIWKGSVIVNKGGGITTGSLTNAFHNKRIRGIDKAQGGD